MPIRDKEARRKVRDAFFEEVCQARLARAKWGVAYSIWDGEELLEASIRSIRSEVDYVCVVYQEKSWYGKPASADLLPTLHRLKEAQLIDELIEYIPNVKEKPVRQETKKRNMGLAAARKAGCTHYMTMDADEFYQQEELKEAKHYIVRENITHAYCPIWTYGITPTEYLPTRTFYCQFFSKITRFSKHCNDSHATALVDPTRKIRHTPFWLGRSKYFALHNVKMHHMSYIRKSLTKKFENTSDPEAKSRTTDMIDEHEPSPCKDLFGIANIVKNWENE